MNNSTNVFIFKKVFEKVRNKENPIASTFSKNTIFETKFPLPGILKWAEVVREIENVETTPIQNSLSVEYSMHTFRFLNPIYNLLDSLDSGLIGFIDFIDFIDALNIRG